MANKTDIEWCDLTVNPIVGQCPHKCWYCYAEPIRKKMYSREIQFLPERLKFPKKPATIFIGSMIDVFARGIRTDWIQQILDTIKLYRQHTFLFLTKNPVRYREFDFNHINTICGVTEDCGGYESNSYEFSEWITPVKKFISFEPLLGNFKIELPVDIDQIIIGSLNKFRCPVTPDEGGTKKEWVLPILIKAELSNIPVFIKDELLRLYPDLPKRKELQWQK